MKKIKYNLTKDGYINACGYDDSLPFEIDENTPFQTIEESLNYKQTDGKWVKYDPTWVHDFPIRVTIPETVILDDPFYTALIGSIKQLIDAKQAASDTIGTDRVMYFNQLYPKHREHMENDINVKIETNEEFI